MVLSACSAPIEEEPTEQPSVPVSMSASREPVEESPSPTPTEDSPSPQPTVEPDESMTPLRDEISEPELPEPGNDDAGALAFASYYQSALDWAMAAPDPEILEGICLTENQQCERIWRSASMMRENSLTQYGGRSTLMISQGLTIANSDSGGKIVQTELSIEPLEVRDAVGAVVDRADAFAFTVAYHLEWVDDAWMVADAVRVDS